MKLEEPISALRRIPILDNGEPLVPFLEYAPALYWVPRHPVFAYERFRVARQGVAERLAGAAAALPSELRLAVVEAYRAPAIQQAMYEATVRRVREAHPDWRQSHITRAVNRFSARPDPRVPPPHTTGGAVDVHLVTAAGEPVDTVSPYDPFDPRAARTAVAGLSPTAQRNRRLLCRVMEEAGFTNYAMEWWHWSYGEPGWAYRGGHPCAVYGAIEPDGLAEADLEFRVHEIPGF